jgi:hypothetical protein
MIDQRIIPFGKLRPTPRLRAFRSTTMGPAFGAVPDISWIPQVVVGDDQGREGACVLFTYMEWSRIMFPVLDPGPMWDRSNAACLSLYIETCSELGRGDEGLTFEEGFWAAQNAGWLPGRRSIVQVDDLAFLAEQPLLAGYRVTGAIDNVGPHGCLDHAAPLTPVRGLHAMPIVAYGRVEVDSATLRRVICLNHWKIGQKLWGWNGLCMMDETLHHILLSELWRVI